MKNILGLDLGTTSVGWAVVKEAENAEETSSIVNMGVRLTPLSTDEQTHFNTMAGETVNQKRSRQTGARRNLQRYKLRRTDLVDILKEYGIISDDTILYETGNETTFETYRLRAKAVTEEISLNDFAPDFVTFLRVKIAMPENQGISS
jgi:CRISPR-associated endonuclease Csn1